MVQFLHWPRRAEELLGTWSSLVCLRICSKVSVWHLDVRNSGTLTSMRWPWRSWCWNARRGLRYRFGLFALFFERGGTKIVWNTTCFLTSSARRLWTSVIGESRSSVLHAQETSSFPLFIMDENLPSLTICFDSLWGSLRFHLTSGLWSGGLGSGRGSPYDWILYCYRFELPTDLGLCFLVVRRRIRMKSFNSFSLLNSKSFQILTFYIRGFVNILTTFKFTIWN